MKPLVLITYLVLVAAVAGQAVHIQDEATGKPAELQAGDVPNRSDGARDIALDHTEGTHETEKNRTESAGGEAI
ncbi:MAG: hypothetical protein KJO09_01190 [Gammaproteobacteria bacterium]|nr:hypothetical protein [Gammaproteobacteria bacterium]